MSGTVLVFRKPADPGVRTPRSGCPVCGGRRFFHHESPREERVVRHVPAVCGCMEGLTEERELVHDAIGRDAVLSPEVNPTLWATVQRLRREGRA